MDMLTMCFVVNVAWVKLNWITQWLKMKRITLHTNNTNNTNSKLTTNH